MTRTTSRRRLAIGLVAASTVLLSACSGEKADSDAAGGSSSADLPAGVQFDQTLFDKLPPKVQQSKTLKEVVFQNTPFTVIDADGKIQGLSTDIAAAVGKVLGVKIDQGQVAGVPEAKVAVQSGRYDLGFGPFLASAESLKTLTVVQMVATSKSMLYKSGAKVGGLADFCGKKIVSTAGSVPAQQSIKNFNTVVCPKAGRPGVQPMDAPDQSSEIVAVQSGRAFAAQITDSSASYYTHSHPGFEFYVLKKGDPKLFPPVSAGNILNKNNPALSTAYEAALQKLYDSGALKKIYDKWTVAADLIEPSVATKALPAY